MVEDGQGYERILRLVSVDDWDNDLSTFAPANARPFDPETGLGDGWVDHRNYATPTIATPYLLIAQRGIPGTPERGTVPTLEDSGWTNWFISFFGQLPLVSTDVSVYQVADLSTFPSLPSSSATYDYDTRVLSNIGDWSQARISYNPVSERLVCTIATLFNYVDVRSGATGSVNWSPIFTCNAEGDLDVVFTQSNDRPDTPLTGIINPPAGWVADASELDTSGRVSIWQSVGHRPADDANWTWHEPVPFSVDLVTVHLQNHHVFDYGTDRSVGIRFTAGGNVDRRVGANYQDLNRITDWINRKSEAPGEYEIRARLVDGEEVGQFREYTSDAIGVWLPLTENREWTLGSPAHEGLHRSIIEVDIRANSTASEFVTGTYTLSLINDVRRLELPHIPHLTAQRGRAFTYTLPTAETNLENVVYALSNNTGVGVTTGLGIPGMSYNPTTRVLSGTPSRNASTDLRYSATADGLTTAVLFSFTVQEDAVADTDPVLPDIPNYMGSVQNYVDIQLPPAIGGNPPLDYTLTGLPATLTYSRITRRIRGVPEVAQTYPLVYTVTDTDRDTDSKNFSLQIQSRANQRPILPSIRDRNVIVNEMADILLPSATGGDPPLTYTLTGLPSTLAFNSNTRDITGTPRLIEDYQLTYRVEDNDGDFDQEVFTLYSRAPMSFETTCVNLPTIYFGHSQFTEWTLPGAVGGIPPYSYTISASTLGTGIQVDLSSILTVNLASRRVSGTLTRGFPSPTSTNPGGTTSAVTVEWTVTDSRGVSIVFSLVFRYVPSDGFALPVPLYPVDGIVGSPFPLTLPRAIRGVGAITYRVDRLPSTLSFNAGTRTITGTPADNNNGNLIEAVYVATDSTSPDPRTTQSRFCISIRSNTAPDLPLSLIHI